MNGGVPETATVNASESPTVNDRPSGCTVIVGDKTDALTVNATDALVTVPTALVTATP